MKSVERQSHSEFERRIYLRCVKLPKPALIGGCCFVPKAPPTRRRTAQDSDGRQREDSREGLGVIDAEHADINDARWWTGLFCRNVPIEVP